jgi:hypothetical protein
MGFAGYVAVCVQLLNRGHKYGPITDTMDIIKTHKKGKHMNTLENTTYTNCTNTTYT